MIVKYSMYNIGYIYMQPNNPRATRLNNPTRVNGKHLVYKDLIRNQVTWFEAK